MSNLNDLPALGTCRYGNFTFGPSTLTKSIRIRNVKDQAGRTVVHSEYTIALETWITGQPADAAVQAAIRELAVPAQVFVYENHGVGGLKINTGNVKDVAWGPSPNNILCEPGGKGGNACKLTWECVVCIPTCRDAAFTGGAEFNFEMDYEIDEDGNTTRTYTGFVRIAQTRGSGRRLADTADSYREKINPPLLPGFRRIPGNFRLSHDKCTLSFTIIDEQMGLEIPPPGILDIKGPGITYQSDPKTLMKTWQGTIALNIKLARTTSHNVAVKYFFDYVREKTYGLGRTFIPLQMTLNQPEPHGRVRWVNISVGFMVTMPLKELLRKGGIWQPDKPKAGQGWKEWAASMPFGPRGSARLSFSPGDDTIVDLCGGGTISTLSASAPSLKSPEVFDLPDLFPPPTAENSYIAYQISLRSELDGGTVTMRTLPEKASDLKPSGLSGLVGGFASVPTFTGPTKKLPSSGKTTPPSDQGGKMQNVGSDTQKRTKAALVVYLEGFAIRARYRIPVPQFTELGGVKMNPAPRLDKGEGFVQAEIANAGVPVYGARWRFRYTLDEAPNLSFDQLTPDNFQFQTQKI